ncbi:MAG: hypothetical protein MI923_21360 [Phycisphaerales bacterium]|nr:hypothetical protein [Phycisphaerales bacterium]
MATQTEAQEARRVAFAKASRAVHCIIVTGLVVLALGHAVHAEVVSVESKSLTITQGQIISIIFRLDENTTPLLGYSLDIDVTPDINALGTIESDLMATNFFDSENLITAAGLVRDPIFSQIVDPGDGGVFITTNTADLSTVIAVSGVNDALAEVVFRAPEDALGRFIVDLGPASFLSDENVNAVSFDYDPVTLNVIPEPQSSLLCCLVFAAIAARRRP